VQRPGQIEVYYRASNGVARSLWLHYRPLVPTATWDRDVGDGRCEGSSTIICNCAWGPLCDYQKLMFSLFPDWITGWEVCFDDLDSRTWFYNGNVGHELLHTDDPLDRLGVAAAPFLSSRQELEFYCGELEKLVLSGEWESSFKRTFQWEGKQRLTKSRLIRVPGKWGARGLTRGFLLSTDVNNLEAVMDELAQTRLQLDRGARRVDLLEHFFYDAPVVMSLIQLESLDVSSDGHGDFVFLLSCKRELEFKLGSQVMAAADVAQWIDKCLEAEKSKRAVELEWRVSKPDDATAVVSPKPESWYLVTFRWIAPRRFTVLQSDITVQKEYARNLEREVARRTQELQNASQAKTRYLAAMSHELRTPLTGVAGSAMLLRDSTEHSLLSQTQRDLLQILGACSEQFTALLDDMLEIAWMDQPGRAWQLEPIQFSPLDLLYEALDVASFGLTSEQRRLLDLASDLRIQELPVMLLGDARRLRQVVAAGRHQVYGEGRSLAVCWCLAGRGAAVSAVGGSQGQRRWHCNTSSRQALSAFLAGDQLVRSYRSWSGPGAVRLPAADRGHEGRHQL
jgi:hypothetical protein